MPRNDEKVKFCTTVEKRLLEQFRRFFCHHKGDLAIHLENAMRLYIQMFEKSSEHTHIEPSSEQHDISFSQPQPPQQDSTIIDPELGAIIGEISSMASVGGKLSKNLLLQVIARVTGLKDKRSLMARILLLESHGIIRPDPAMRNVYEVVSLAPLLGRNLK